MSKTSTKKRQLFAVIALTRDAKGKILLQKRHDPSIPEAHGKWEFPGGGVEFGETLEAALQRGGFSFLGGVLYCPYVLLSPRHRNNRQAV